MTPAPRRPLASRRAARPRAGPWLSAAVVMLAGAAMAPAARAQSPDATLRQEMATDSVLRATLRVLQAVPVGGQPRVMVVPSPFEPLSSHEPPALDPASHARIQRAAILRNQGRFAAARDSLAPLVAALPHHPFVLTEWCRTLLALQDFASVDRLARAERASQSDSVLLARALAEAAEHLGRPTDAALTAIEAWAATPLMGNWADAELSRPMNFDVARAREAMRRAVARDSSRGDLALGLARLDWRANDLPATIRSLRAAGGAGGPGSPRHRFAEELLQTGSARDSSAAIEIMLDLAADRSLGGPLRNFSARRAWTLAQARGDAASGAARIASALADLPATQWDGTLALGVARALRQSGHTREARALLDAAPESSGDLALERALTDLRDGPPARALPALARLANQSSAAAYTYAEALFFDGQCDSAHTWYVKAGGDAAGEKTGAALERAFLIEDASPRGGLPAYGRACYAAWRGDSKAALALTDSLYRALPRGSLWAEAALSLSAQHLAAGNSGAALEPLLAVADSMPESRLAPLARERAGDLCRDQLHDPKRAIEQYEACLTRYPGAWNAPAVRRSLEALRRDQRF